MNLEKLRSPANATFKNSKISLQIVKKLEVQPNSNVQEIPVLILWLHLKNVFLNLGFTVENGIANLYKIRLFTFQI